MYTNYYETLEEEEPCSKIQFTPLLSPPLQMQKDFLVVQPNLYFLSSVNYG